MGYLFFFFFFKEIQVETSFSTKEIEATQWILSWILAGGAMN